MVALALVLAVAVLTNKMPSIRQLYAQDALFYR
jgi:hypothetical protein